MSFLPDSNWISALKLPTQVMIGLFIASIILLIFDRSEFLQLSQFGELTKPIIIIVAVFSGSLSLTGILSFCKDQMIALRKQSLLACRRKIKEEETENERIKTERSILERLDHLSSKELHYLANCLKDSSQSFFAYVHSPPVATLMGKGLVYTPGGAHHQDHYPFTIYDFVWKHILERKDELIEKHENFKREDK